MNIFKFFGYFFSLSFIFSNVTSGMEHPPTPVIELHCDVCKKNEPKAIVYDVNHYTTAKNVCSIGCATKYINICRKVFKDFELQVMFPEDNNGCTLCGRNNIEKLGFAILPCGHAYLCFNCYLEIDKSNKKDSKKCFLCRKDYLRMKERTVSDFLYIPNSLKENNDTIKKSIQLNGRMSWMRKILRNHINDIGFSFFKDADKFKFWQTNEGKIASIAYNALNVFDKSGCTEQEFNSFLSTKLAYCEFYGDSTFYFGIRL